MGYHSNLISVEEQNRMKIWVNGTISYRTDRQLSAKVDRYLEYTKVYRVNPIGGSSRFDVKNGMRILEDGEDGSLNTQGK